MKVVDSRRMAEIDRIAQKRFSIPDIVLMEDAGSGIFSALWRTAWREKLPQGPVVFLAGKGNNGGDALVVARHCAFAGVRNLSVILGAGEPKAGSLAAIHLKILRSLGIEVVDYTGSGGGEGNRRRPAGRAAIRRAHRLVGEAAWLVDGLLGTGLTGEVRSPLKDLILRCNESLAHRVAVDIPSGVGDAYRKGYAAFRADCTLTVQVPKLCLFLPHCRRHCGEIRTVPGVFPPELIDDQDIPGYLIDESVKREFLRPLEADTHKGKRGHLAVFAGAEGTTGAAWLCANAAARSRAGLVSLYLDRALYGPNVAKYSSVMLRPWEGKLPEMDRFDTLLVGPGWGVSEQRRQILRQLFQTGLPGVLDADGITLLAAMLKDHTPARAPGGGPARAPGGGPARAPGGGPARAPGGGPKLKGRWILTPHPGEFARLLGVETADVLADPLPYLLRSSAELEAVILLKGHCSFVATPEGRYGVLDGMNPAMATGGSGDVLAGMCAGLLASGCTPEQAASLACLLHSEIGGRLYRERGYFLAEDMIGFVSSAFGQREI